APREGSSLLVGVAVALRAPVLSSLLARLRRSRPAEPTCAATPRQFRDPGRSLSWVCRSHARDERPRHETQVAMVDAFAACLNLLDGHLSDTSLLCPPNRVKLRMRSGWMYLVVVLDWYSRYVVSWALSQSLEVDFVLEAVEQAFEKAKPQILNSDQGSQYTSPAYIQLVESAGVRISMDGRGRALDNVFTERLWRSLKYEEVYLSDYVTPRQTRESISGYLEYYNERRPHQALNYQTPATVYASRGIELPAIMLE